MSTIDEELREAIAADALHNGAGEQLRQAARVLAASPGSVDAITCVRRVKPGERAELVALARSIAAAHDLEVKIELGDQIAIRFERHSVTSR